MPIISKLLLYGVANPSSLDLQSIRTNTIQVAPLQLYTFNHHSSRPEAYQENLPPQYYSMWAYPDGIKILDEELNVLNDPRSENSFGSRDTIHGSQATLHSFVFTDYGLKRSYNTCLTFYERRFIKNLSSVEEEKVTLPKCSLTKLRSLSSMSRNIVIYVPKCLILFSDIPCFDFQRQLLEIFYASAVSGKEVAVDRHQLNIFKELAHTVGYPEAEKSFDQAPMSSAFQSNSFKQTTSHKKILESFPLSEEEICKFYCSFFFVAEFPPNCFTLQIEDKQHPPSTFMPLCASVCYSLPNVDIIGVINHLGIKNLLKIWKCLILEKQVVIFSENNYDLINTCESLIYLIEPLKWQNVYIPFLPFHIHYNVDAVGGLLIGMARIHMDYMIEHFQMQDKVLVDYGQNVVIEEGGKNEVELPVEIYDMLQERLAVVLDSLKFKGKSNCLREIQSVRQIFFDGLLYLLNNYRPYASIGANKSLDFDRKEYIAMLSPSWQPFMKELCRTMVFVRLCEYHLYEEKILQWNQSNFGGLFVYCQNILSQKFTGKQMWQINKIIECKAGRFMNRAKVEWSYAYPYSKYVSYVLEKDYQKILKCKKVISVEHKLIKFLCFREIKHPFEPPFSEEIREVDPVDSNFTNKILGYIFPWYNEEGKAENVIRSKQILMPWPDLYHLRKIFNGFEDKPYKIRTKKWGKKYQQNREMEEIGQRNSV